MRVRRARNWEIAKPALLGPVQVVYISEETYHTDGVEHAEPQTGLGMIPRPIPLKQEEKNISGQR